MSYPAQPTRRHLLAALISTPTLLAACGGGGGQRDEILDPRLLTENQRLQDQASAAVQPGGLAGVVIASQYHSASKLYRACAGRRRQPQGAPLQGDESFSTGSLGKAMTAALAARLVEQGRLRWDSRPVDLIPTLATLQQPAYANITLTQLLDHRSGLPYGGEDDLATFLAAWAASGQPEPATPVLRRRAVLAWALQSPPAGPTGEFLYSNIGYELVAWMLEAAAGDSFEALLQREIHQPLGLSLLVQPPADGTTGHAGPSPAALAVAEVPAPVDAWLQALQGSGGQWMTASAYARWLREHQRALQGQGSLLPADYLRRLRALRPGEYALGWQGGGTVQSPLLVHSGGMPGFTSLVAMRQDGQAACFAFSNTQASGGGTTDWVADCLDSALSAVLLGH